MQSKGFLAALLVAMLTVVACKKNQPSTKTPTKTQKLASAEAANEAKQRAGCRQRAQAVARALRKLGDLPQTTSTARRFRLVRLEGARYAPHQLEVTIGRERPGRSTLVMTLEGSEVAVLPNGRRNGARPVPARLAEQLKTHWSNWSVVHPGEKLAREVLLSVERHVSWEVIVDLIRGLASIGVGRVGLLVAVSDPSSPMPPSRVTAALKVMEREVEGGIVPLGTKTSAQRQVKSHWNRAIKDCPRVAKAFTKMAGVAPEQKGRVLAEGLERALIACNCRADIPTIHAVMYVALHHRPTGVVWLRFDRKGRRIARPAREPWEQTVARWLRSQPRKTVHGHLVAE